MVNIILDECLTIKSYIFSLQEDIQIEDEFEADAMLFACSSIMSTIVKHRAKYSTSTFPKVCSRICSVIS